MRRDDSNTPRHRLGRLRPPHVGTAARNPNASRVRLDDFARRAAASVPSGARVLDAGSGRGPYRAHFAHAAYESADFQKLETASGTVDHVCRLDKIPVESERFDLVFCSQVLEHLPEPGDVLAELAIEFCAQAAAFGSARRSSTPSTISPTTSTVTPLSVCATACRAPASRSRPWIGSRATSARCHSKSRPRADPCPKTPSSDGGGPLGTACAGLARLARPALRVVAERSRPARVAPSLHEGGPPEATTRSSRAGVTHRLLDMARDRQQRRHTAAGLRSRLWAQRRPNRAGAPRGAAPSDALPAPIRGRSTSTTRRPTSRSLWSSARGMQA